MSSRPLPLHPARYALLGLLEPLASPLPSLCGPGQSTDLRLHKLHHLLEVALLGDGLVWKRGAGGRGTVRLQSQQEGQEQEKLVRTVVALEELLENRLLLAVSVVSHVGNLGELVHVLARDDLVLPSRQEEDGQVGGQSQKLGSRVPLLAQEPGEAREGRGEGGDEVAHRRERVFEDERSGDRRVGRGEVDGGGTSDRLTKQEDGSLAENRVVGDEVEGSLGVALKGRRKGVKRTLKSERVSRVDR